MCAAVSQIISDGDRHAAQYNANDGYLLVKTVIEAIRSGGKPSAMSPPPTTRTRRSVLAGGGCSFLSLTLAGCLASGVDGPEQPGPDDDSESKSESESESETPTQPDQTISHDPLQAEAYPTETYDGTELALATAEETHDWLTADEAIVADTRTEKAYDKVRIDGARWSPEPNGRSDGDPLEALPPDRPIVVYGAPESDGPRRRATTLLADGYQLVFVLEGGLKAWQAAALPLGGKKVE